MFIENCFELNFLSLHDSHSQSHHKLFLEYCWVVKWEKKNEHRNDNKSFEHLEVGIKFLFGWPGLRPKNMFV